MSQKNVVFQTDRVRRLQKQMLQISQDTNDLRYQIQKKANTWDRAVPMLAEMQDILREMNRLTEQAEHLEGVVSQTIQKVEKLQEENRRKINQWAQTRSGLMTLIGHANARAASIYAKLPPGAKKIMGHLANAVTSVFRDELSYDPYVKELENKLKSSKLTKEERNIIEAELKAIFDARDGIGKAQVAFQVYKKFGNKKMMEIAHKYAEEQRQRLRDLGIDEKYFLNGKDLRHHFKSSEVQAVSYDPRSPVPIKMPDNDQYKFLLGLLLKGGNDAEWAKEKITNYNYFNWTGDPYGPLNTVLRDKSDEMKNNVISDALLLLVKTYPNLTSEDLERIEVEMRKSAFEDVDRALLLNIPQENKVAHLINSIMSNLNQDYSDTDTVTQSLSDKLLNDKRFTAYIQDKSSILNVPLPDGPKPGVVGTVLMTPIKVVVETIDGVASTAKAIYDDPGVVLDALSAVKDKAFAEIEHAYTDPLGYYNEKKEELKMSYKEFMYKTPEEKAELITRLVIDGALARVSFGATKAFKAADGAIDAVKDDKDFDKGDNPVKTPEMDKPSKDMGKGNQGGTKFDDKGTPVTTPKMDKPSKDMGKGNSGGTKFDDGGTPVTTPKMDKPSKDMGKGNSGGTKFDDGDNPVKTPEIDKPSEGTGKPRVNIDWSKYNRVDDYKPKFMDKDEELEYKVASRDYDEIRSAGMTDIEQVAKNTGMTIEEIRAMKQHMFFDTHKIPLDNHSYRVGNFTPDIEIGFIWKMAQEGELNPKQKQWFQEIAKHELTESELMKHGHPYKDPDSYSPEWERFDSKPPGAHDLASPQPKFELPDSYDYIKNSKKKLEQMERQSK